MKLIVFGGNGMLGHRLGLTLSRRHECLITFRHQEAEWLNHPSFIDWHMGRAIGNVDVESEPVNKLIERFRPDAIVNCIGIVKQRAESEDAIATIRINSLFPFLLNAVAEKTGVRLIHLSTDCVFSGRKGNYGESDIPDPIDMYGKSKLLGEVVDPPCLTLRTSMIGWELRYRQGLLEWFATQRGQKIFGYRRAIFTGLSTLALADLIVHLLEKRPNLTGLYHVASKPISKFNLLKRMRDELGWKDISILPDDEFKCDRSLNGQAFNTVTGWQPPSWESMISELAEKWATYRDWREEDNYG